MARLEELKRGAAVKGILAETLFRAKNTAVNGLVQAGIVSARGGKVRLVKRDELPADWNPTADKRLTV